MEPFQSSFFNSLPVSKVFVAKDCHFVESLQCTSDASFLFVCLFVFFGLFVFVFCFFFIF